MTETEIERMVVRLMGDSSNYQKMVDDAVKQGQALERANAQITESERARQAAMVKGAAITKSLMTDTERYNDTLSEMSELLRQGAISRKTFDQVMKQNENLLPAFAEANRKAAIAEAENQRLQAVGAQLTRNNLTAKQRYAQGVAELDSVMRTGTITQSVYDAEFKKLTNTYKAAELASSGMADKIAQGRQLTEEAKSTAAKYGEQIAQYDSLLKAGTISQETYNYHVGQAKNQYIAAAGAVSPLVNQLSNLGGTLIGTGAAITAMGAVVVGSLGSMGSQALRSAQSFEQTMTSYEAMLGSRQKAEKLLGELTDLGAKTPFEMPTLLSATRMLLQFQVPAKEVVGILKSIGDVTGGSDPGKVQSMAYAFSQMSAAGRLMGGDLMQMINAGFNPLNEMAKTTGKSLQQLRQEMGEGKITADMVKEAFAAASGRLNLMEKQSQTLEGRISTLNDNIGILMRSLGNILLPIKGFFVDIKASVVGFFNTLSEDTKKYIVYAGLFTFAVGTGITAVGALSVSVGGLVMVFAGAIAALDTLQAKMAAYTAVTAGATGGTTSLSVATVGYLGSLSLSSIALKGYNAVMSVFSVRAWASAAATIAQTTAQMGYTVAARVAAAVTGVSTAAMVLWASVCAATTDASILASLKSLQLAASRAFEAAMTTLATAATWMYIAAVTAGLALVVVVTGAVYLLAKAWWDYNAAVTKGAELTQTLIDVQKKQTTSDIAGGKSLQTVDQKKEYFETLIRQAKQSEEQLQSSVEQLRRNKRSGVFNKDDENVLKDTEKLLEAAKGRVEELDIALIESQGMTEMKKELEAVSTLVDSYQGKLDSANQTVQELSKIPNPTEGQQKALEEAKQSAEKYTKALDSAKDRMEHLTKSSTLKTTAELEEALKNVDKETRAIGKTPAQVVAEVALEQGASPEKVQEFTHKSAHKEALLRQNEVFQSIKGTVTELEKQAAVQEAIGDRTGKSQEEIKLAELRHQAAIVGTTEAMDEQLAKLEELVAAKKLLDAQQTGKAAIQQLTDQLAVQGMTPEQASNFKLRTQGVGEGDIAKIEALQQQIKAGDMAKTIDDVNKKYAEQAATIKMTTEEVELYKLKMAGATEAQLESVKAAQQTAKAAEKQKELMEQGKQLAEKYKTPEQKKQDQKLELDKLWEAGAVSAEVYTKALKDIEDQARESGKQMSEMTGDVESAFSAEHVTRVRKYFEEFNKDPSADKTKRQLQEQASLMTPDAQVKKLYVGVKPNVVDKSDQLLAYMNRFEGGPRQPENLRLAANDMLPKRLQMPGPDQMQVRLNQEAVMRENDKLAAERLYKPREVDVDSRTGQFEQFMAQQFGDMKAPEVPNLIAEVPKLIAEVPKLVTEVPDLKVPQIPALEAPEISPVELYAGTKPDSEIANAQMMKYMERFSQETPSIPGASVPEPLRVPSLEIPDVPDMGVSQLPKLQIEIPKLPELLTKELPRTEPNEPKVAEPKPADRPVEEKSEDAILLTLKELVEIAKQQLSKEGVVFKEAQL